jgi:CRP-like cAMP-binding protein
MLDIYERVLLFKQSPMFSEVSTDDLRVVARELEEEQYLAGERVFDISEQGDHMYILLSGRAGISINPDPNVKEFVAEIGPGECFGEMSMLDDLPRSATVHILEDTTVLSLEKARLRALIINYPALSIGMLRGFSIRLREAHDRYKNA